MSCRWNFCTFHPRQPGGNESQRAKERPSCHAGFCWICHERSSTVSLLNFPYMYFLIHSSRNTCFFSVNRRLHCWYWQTNQALDCSLPFESFRPAACKQISILQPGNALLMACIKHDCLLTVSSGKDPWQGEILGCVRIICKDHSDMQSIVGDRIGPNRCIAAASPRPHQYHNLQQGHDCAGSGQATPLPNWCRTQLPGAACLHS